VNVRTTLKAPKWSQTTDELTLLLGRGFLFLILLFVLFVRLRLLAFPLERDEGEYAYVGQLLLRGFPPYSHAYNMKFPGTYMAYAFFMSIFGQTTQGIHLGLMLINFFTVLLVYYLGKKVIGEFAGIIAAVSYAVLSLSFSVLGFAAHATHFVLLPALGGILLLLEAMENHSSRTYFSSGVLLGVSVMMLQTGFFFFLFCVSFIIYHYFSSRRQQGVQCITSLGIFTAGALLPIIGVVTWLYFSDVLDRFWFWTIVYAYAYGSQIPLTQSWGPLGWALHKITSTFVLLWIISARGLIIGLFRRSSDMKRAFFILFFASSLLSVCPGFYFRQHYFVTLLPAISLCIGIFFDNLNTARMRLIGLGIFAIIIAAGIVNHREYFFAGAPTHLSKEIYDSEPFPETLTIAQFIRRRTAATDRIAVLGSEPQIYFYSGRQSADGYIYAYCLMEKQPYALLMQKEMIAEIEASQPKFIVVVREDRSWGLTPFSVRYVFRWARNYLQSHYELVGVADIFAHDTTVYKWDRNASNYVVRGMSSILVYEKRRTDAAATAYRGHLTPFRSNRIATLPSKS
jgi:hypothetical protein